MNSGNGGGGVQGSTFGTFRHVTVLCGASLVLEEEAGITYCES
jgi:hypothetical protein